jgi:hypothetical protein
MIIDAPLQGSTEKPGCEDTNLETADKRLPAFVIMRVSAENQLKNYGD